MPEPSLEKAQILSVLKHDMNNVLTGVKTGLEIMAMDEFFEDEDNAEDLNDVKKASIRMVNMLEDLALVFGDEPELRPDSRSVSVEELQKRIVDQLAMESISVECHNFPDGGSELSTHPESLVRALFYGSLLLNELEKGPINLELETTGLTWVLNLSSAQSASLAALISGEVSEGRPSFLLKMTKLAAQRLGATLEQVNEKWSLRLGSVV